MKCLVIENAEERLAAHPNPPECWMWCLSCNRFFQLKSVRKTSGMFAQCPFSDCTECGIGLGLHVWDAWREPDDSRWPSSEDELEHGMRSPDMQEFYAAQLAARIHDLTSSFARSPELEEELGSAAPRYVPEFLQMLSDLCWDITDDDEDAYLDEDMARLLTGDLPVWSQTAELTEAPRMTAELRAFFRFAARTGCIESAEQWLQVLEADDIDELFRHTMRTDKRLQPASASGSAATARARRVGSRRWRRSKR